MAEQKSIIGAHHSGRFDRPRAAFKADLEMMRKHASFTTHTEVTSPSRRAVFVATSVHWDYFHPYGAGARDTAVTWDRSVWRRVPQWRPYSHIVSRVTWIRSRVYGGRRTVPTHAAVVPLQHIDTGDIVVVIVCHMPTRNTALRRLAWLHTAAGIRRLVRRARRRHPHAKIWLAADTNVEMRKHDGMALLRRKIATPLRLRNVWANHLPTNGGTHGFGVIDTVFTDVRDTHPHLLPNNTSSDHRGFKVVGTL